MDKEPTIERLWSDSIEFRASSADRKGPGTLAGYALRWNSLSEPLKGGFRETFRSGAFGTGLAGSDVLAVVEHAEGARNIFGRSTAGTLRLVDDGAGLRFENDLPDTSAGRDLAVQVARGDIRGVSVAFIPSKVSWEQPGSDMPTRVVHQATIRHLSYEARPAYRDTSVALWSLESARHSVPDISVFKARIRLAELD